jgi:hypothetical protein
MMSPFSRVSSSKEPPKRKVFHYSLARGDTVELKTCKNAWVPSCLKAKDTSNGQPLNEEDAQIEVNNNFVK